MFLPPVHAETDTPVLLEFIRQNPLGILTTGIKSSNYDFLQSSHVPVVLDFPNDEVPQGKLRAHLAKQNPQVKAMIESNNDNNSNDNNNLRSSIIELEDDVLILFTSKHNYYITPKFYTETKPSTAKVVPTWNYSAVQVYGRLVLYSDSKSPETSAFLDRQLHDLSENSERGVMGYTGDGEKPEPWEVSDAPERYTELLKRNIVGIEVKISKIEGKFKMSQEMRKGDRENV